MINTNDTTNLTNNDYNEIINFIAFRDVDETYTKDKVNQIFNTYGHIEEIKEIKDGYRNPLIVSSILLIRSEKI